jgi:glycosyltransferase involved in cell wall biosynthesis
VRILALQPYGDGAGHFAKYTLRVCQQIALAGHELTLVVNWIDVAAQLVDAPEFEIVQLGDAYRFFPADASRLQQRNRWMHARMRNNVAVLRRAAALAKSRPYDVMQWFSYEVISSWLTTAAIGRTGFPPVVMEVAAANFAPEKHYGSLAERAWRRLMRVAMRRLVRGPVHGINVNSASHEAALREQLDLPVAFPIEVVSDTREIPDDPPSRADARWRLGLGDYRGPVFLFFGTLRRDKGIATLAAALRALGDAEFRMVIAGMPLDWDFPGASGDLLHDPRVHVRREYVPEAEVDAHFFAADALVLPYPGFYAGSSGPLYEACARSLPVIVSDVSEMGHIVRAHGNGLVVPPDDAPALERAMRAVIVMGATDLDRMRRAALAIATTVTREAVAKRFCTLYDRVARPDARASLPADRRFRDARMSARESMP